MLRKGRRDPEYVPDINVLPSTYTVQSVLLPDRTQCNLTWWGRSSNSTWLVVVPNTSMSYVSSVWVATDTRISRGTRSASSPKNHVCVTPLSEQTAWKESIPPIPMRTMSTDHSSSVAPETLPLAWPR